MTDIANKLAQEHWAYVRSILSPFIAKGHNVSAGELMSAIELHYVTAFVHGFKHGADEVMETLRGGKD